jgi:hypothetical protein
MRVNHRSAHIAMLQQLLDSVNTGATKQTSQQRQLSVDRMSTYEKAYPVEVGFLSAQAIVQTPNPFANLIHQADRAQRDSAGFHRIFITVYIYSIRY